MCLVLQVNHQIWLLKNIFWWYLLPILIGLSAFSAQTLWSNQAVGLTSTLESAAIFIHTYGVTYGFVYWLNQRASKSNWTRAGRNSRRCLPA